MNSKRILTGLILLVALGGIAFFVARKLNTSPEALRKRADAHYEKGDYEAALLDYRTLLGKDPANAYAYRQAGHIWMERGAPLRALPFLIEALKLEPAEIGARTELATILLGLGDIRGARKELLSILNLSPTDGKALRLLANTSFGEEWISEARQRLDAVDPARSAAYHLATAILSAREGKNEEIEALLKKALALDPESVPVHLAYATFYVSTNDQEKVLSSLKRASELSGPRSNAGLLYAQALARVGKVDEAQKFLEALVTKADDYLPAYRLMAEFQAAKGLNDEALETLAKVLRLDSVNLDARSVEARVYVAKGEPNKAVEVYEGLEQAYPDVPKIKLALARAYLRNNEQMKGVARLETLVQSISERRVEWAEALSLLAEIDLRTGNAPAASKKLEKLVKTRPDLPKAPLMLARAYRAEGRLEDAANIFRQLVTRNPDDAGPHFGLAQILKQQKRPEEAMKSFEEAQKHSPEDQTITIELVGLDIARKDFASAHARVKPLLDQDEPDWGAWYLEGMVLAAEEKWSEAEVALLQALELKPGSLTVYNLLVDSYMKAGKVDEAIKRLEALAAENPKAVQHRLALCLLQEEQEQWEEAGVGYQALVDEFPDFVPALNNLAYLYGNRLGKLPEAEALARKARDLQESDPAITDTLGWILVQQGGDAKVREGLGLLKEAAATLEHPEVRYHLGVALSRTGDREEARKRLTQALASEAEFNGKTDAAALLAALTGSSSGMEGLSLAQLEARRLADPLDIPVRVRIGELQEAQGNTAAAIAAYEEILKLDQKHASSLMALAGLLESGDPAKARSFARQAWEATPDDAKCAALEGRWSLKEGFFTQAYQLMKPEAASSKEAALLADFATAAYSIGRIDEARAAMQRVSPESPRSAAAATFLALTAATGPEGLAALEVAAAEALQNEADLVPALMVQASKLNRDGKEQEAIVIYEGILGRLKEFPPVQLNLAVLYAQNPERLAEAEALALDVLEGTGHSSELDRILGEIMVRKGKPEAAIPLLTATEKASGLDAEGLFFLGKAYLSLDPKKVGEGREKLAAALKAGLDGGSADEAKVMLEDAE